MKQKELLKLAYPPATQVKIESSTSTTASLYAMALRSSNIAAQNEARIERIAPQQTGQAIAMMLVVILLVYVHMYF